MNKEPWSTASQDKLPVSWNGATKTFSIFLSGLKDVIGKDHIEAEWTPPITYVVRIRETGTENWSFGFETPLTGCGFEDLKPNTEYELEIRSKNEHGKSGPALIKFHTGSQGTVGI